MLNSSRPYLTRALYNWLVDNDNTPYIVVDALQKDVVVPEQYIQNGQIVLNISHTAVRNLDMSNEMIRFNARFSGKAMEVWVPMSALIAIYSHEHGTGMVFGQEPVLPEVDEQSLHLQTVTKAPEHESKKITKDTHDKKSHKKSTLRVIK